MRAGMHRKTHNCTVPRGTAAVAFVSNEVPRVAAQSVREGGGTGKGREKDGEGRSNQKTTTMLHCTILGYSVAHARNVSRTYFENLT